MNTFDIKHFAQLIKEASKTNYFKKALWSPNVKQFYDDINSIDMLEEYTNEDILIITEDIAFCDKTVQMPPEVAACVEYGYSIAIEIKDATRINNFGCVYYTGSIGYQDYAKAAKYYQMASDLGESLSAENLGYIHYYGRTGKVDYKKAYECYYKAYTLHKRVCSTYKLGDMYKNGYYVEKDPNKAFDLYNQAMSFIDSGLWNNREDNVGGDVYFRLGECYHKGIGTEVDLDLALKYYHKAERGFIVKVRNGDYMVKKLLIKSIEYQDEVREILINELPGMEWARKYRGFLNL